MVISVTDRDLITLMRRKLLFIISFFILGIMASYYARYYAALLIVGILASLCITKLYTNRVCVRIVIAFTIGILVMLSCQYRIDNNYLNRFVGHESNITGKVTNIIQKDSEYFQITVKTSKGKILCSYYNVIEEHSSLIGKTISFIANLEKPKHNSNPRTFDYNLYLRTKKIYFVTVIDAFNVTDVSVSRIDKLKVGIIEKREELLSQIATSELTLGFIRGVLFGDINMLDEEVYEEFRDNSTAHILAVSGLHIGMLFALFRSLKKKIGGNIIDIIFLASLFIYGTATLWSISVIRATSLILLVMISERLDRRYDLMTAVSLVAGVSMFFNPYIIFGASFQMSFLAVISIVFLTPFFQNYISETFGGVLAVQIGLMPYMIYMFNKITVIGFIANLPVVFMVSILVPVGAIGYLIYYVCGLILPFLPNVVNGLSGLIIWTNHLFSRAEFFQKDLPSMKFSTLIFIYFSLFFISSELFRILKGRKKYKEILLSIGVILTIITVSFFANLSSFDVAQITFVDVGQGDCTHVRAKNNIDILIDGGGNVNRNVGEKILKPYLLKNGIEDVDMALATHLHMDHFLGLEELSKVYKVNKLVKKGVKGQSIELDPYTKIDILWPIKRDETVDDENTNSMVFKVTIKDMKVLITGDITSECEHMLVEDYRGTDVLKCDILRIAHHGSRDSSSDEFLDEVSPKIAVISVGKNNYGHPSNEVLKKLEKRNILTYRTDKDGAICARYKGEKIIISTMLKYN